MTLLTDDEIREIIEKWNDLESNTKDDLHAAFWKFDQTTEQVFIVIEEDKKMADYYSLEPMLQEGMGPRILLGYIASNFLFDLLLRST